jgi:hypothetical protein
MNMVTPMLGYLKDDSVRVSSQTEAKRVISSIASKVTDLQWLQNLLYQFL